ncbi:MAG: hypothetical protein Q4G19_02795 [Clostridia bacterium]|nr:hypothetical protein [Clostridia bacterium]
MTTTEFLTLIAETAAQVKSYRLGGSAADGTSDCIGLIIGALKRGGISWPGIHGTNWAWRNAVKDTAAVSSAADTVPGDLLFKAYDPGDAGYALPSRYNSSKDRKDYYHVGVVTAVDPLRITHCTSGGIKTDTKIGQWKYRAKLKYLKDEPAAPAAESKEKDAALTRAAISEALESARAIRENAEKLEQTLSTALKE